MRQRRKARQKFRSRPGAAGSAKPYAAENLKPNRTSGTDTVALQVAKTFTSRAATNTVSESTFAVLLKSQDSEAVMHVPNHNCYKFSYDLIQTTPRI